MLIQMMTKRLLWIGTMILIAAVSGCNEKSNEKKHDIQGWETGISHDDVLKRLESMHCSTSGVRPNEQSIYHSGLVAECGSDRFIFQFSPYLENQPVIEVSMTIHTSRSLQDVIRSVEEQYQVSLGEPPNLTPLSYREYKADLSAGRRISVLQNKPRDFNPAPSSQPGDNSLVIISDGRLVDASNAVKAKSEAEKAEIFRRNNPLPKY